MKAYLKTITYLKDNGYATYHIKWCIFFTDICFTEVDFFLICHFHLNPWNIDGCKFRTRSILDVQTSTEINANIYYWQWKYLLYYIFFQIDTNALICISWLPFYCILSILCKHSLHRHFLAAICKLHATLVRTSYVFSLNQTVFDALIIKTRILWMMDALKARYFKTSTVIRNINEITSPSVIFLLLLCKP